MRIIYLEVITLKIYTTVSYSATNSKTYKHYINNYDNRIEFKI